MTTRTELINGYASFNNGGHSLRLLERSRDGRPSLHLLEVGTHNMGMSTTASITVFPGMAQVLRDIAAKIDELDVRAPDYLAPVHYKILEPKE